MDNRAATRVMIVDCCYSGRATTETLSAADQAVLGQLEISGTYTLASAPPNRLALAPEGERYTAFTGRMLELLREGSDDAGERLTMADIYRHLLARLTAEGMPLPQQRGTATADQLGLVRNRRFGVTAPRPLPAYISALLDSADAQERLDGVSWLGGWLADPDPGRNLTARQRLEYIAYTAHPEVAAARALLEPVADAAAPALAAATLAANAAPAAATAVQAAIDVIEVYEPSVDPLVRRALALAALAADATRNRAVNTYHRAVVLARVAEVVARIDPGAALDRIQQAERSAASVADPYQKAKVLLEIVRAAEIAAPQRAPELIKRAGWLAESVQLAIERVYIHLDVAALAKVDSAEPDQLTREAHQFANRTQDAEQRASIFVKAALVVAWHDHQQADSLLREAERYTNMFSTKAWSVSVLLQVAKIRSAYDLDRAELQIAQLEAAITTFSDTEQNVLRADLATVIAATDPDRAEAIVDTIESQTGIAMGLSGVARALARTATARPAAS